MTESQSAGCVLLVEDEETVRKMTERMLRMHGYDVVVACDGNEGWEVLEDKSQDFAFVVSDVVMPGLGGWDLLQKVRESGIKVPFVFMSGYTHGVGDGESAEEGGWVFLQKPFSTKQLLQSIEQVTT